MADGNNEEANLVCWKVLTLM